MATTRKLIVEIAEAHNLFPKDGTGTLSPYACVDFDGQRRKTRTVTRDLNPVWNEALEFNLFGTDGRTFLGELLEVSVFHDVRVGPSRRNCFLGRVRLDSRHFVKKGEEALMYFPLEKKSFFGRVRGEIGLKVYYVEKPVPEPVPVPEPAPAPPQEQNGTDTPAAEATQGEETPAAAPPPTEAEAASAAAAPPESAAKPTDVPESALPPAEQPADETRGTENAEADIADQPAVDSAADLNPPLPEQEKLATPQWVPPPRQVPRRQETAPELGATAPPKYDGNISFQGDGVGGSMASAKIGNSVSDGTSSSLAVPKSTKPGFRMSVSEDFLDDDEEETNEKAETTTVPVKNDFHKVEFGTSKQGKESKLPEQKGTAPASEAKAAPAATAKPDNNVLSSPPPPVGETSGKPTESASFSASPSSATEAPVKPVFAFGGSSSPKFSFSAVPATTPITQTAFTSSTTASVTTGANVPSPAPEAPKFSFVQFGASNASSSQTLPSPSVLDDLGAKASDTNAVKPVTFGSSPNVSASSATATELQNAAAPPAGTLTTATTSTGLFSSNVTGHSNSGITSTPTFTFGTSEKSTTPSVPTFAFAFAFGNSAITATVTTSSPSVAPTPVSTSTSTSMTTPGVTFGGSGTTCAFTFGASSQPSSSRCQSAPFTFGATSTNTSTGIFGFGASSSQNAGSSTSTPSSGSSQPSFAFGASTGSIFGSKPVQPFGQAASPLPAPAFQFGAPSGASPALAFQFGAQPSQSLFQPGSSLEFNAGSQVSGSGAGDKANRRIVKVRWDKTRRK